MVEDISRMDLKAAVKKKNRRRLKNYNDLNFCFIQFKAVSIKSEMRRRGGKLNRSGLDDGCAWSWALSLTFI